MKEGRSLVWYVGGDDGLAALIRQQFRWWKLVHSRSVRDAATAKLDGSSLGLLFVDCDESVGCRVAQNEVFAWLRTDRRVAKVPVVLVTMAVPTPALVNRAQLRDYQLLHKHSCVGNLQAMAERLELAESATSWAHAAYLEWLRDGCGISDRQFEAAALALKNVSRDEIAEHMGISVNTVDTHTAELRRRAGVSTLDELRHQAAAYAVRVPRTAMRSKSPTLNGAE